ncbi:MAG: hypothetical protein ACK55Z_09465, partial [bacterium]
RAPRRHIAAPSAAVRGPVRGVGEGRQAFPASSGRPRGDGQHRLPEAASGIRAFYGGPPAARGRPLTSAPVVFQPQHPPAAVTTGGTVAEYINI